MASCLIRLKKSSVSFKGGLASPFFNIMRIINYNKILSQDKKFLLSAKMAAERSVTENKHRVGCILICAMEESL